ncbi:ATP-binding protein [Candidatus Shapirobacteria bacterium]|nr:ATP-binding protein [Candidatus Shapirobacteria bacterium]
MAPIQYLLVGLPYSGKSTLASALKDTFGFAHINIDELKFAKGYKDAGDDDVPDSVWEEIFTDADNLIAKYLKEGRSVANEYAWVTRDWRNRARKIATDLGFETKVIYIKLPIETVKKRWEENMHLKKRFHWPEGEFENYIKDFEEPTADEKILIYDQSISIDNWIKMNLPN